MQTAVQTKTQNKTKNGAVQQKKQVSIQRKTSPSSSLTIGPPNDRYEREADAMADRIMRMPQTFSSQPLSNTANSIQRACAACAHEEDEIRRKPLMMKSEGGTPLATPALQSQLNSSKGSGQPLPSTTNNFMSEAFGSDFSSVRIHTDNRATTMNQGLQARAFTYGTNIYFNRGEYSPNTSKGKHLLGHELTHVVQQRGTIQRQSPPAPPAGGNANAPAPAVASTVTINPSCTNRQDIVDIVNETLLWLDDAYKQLLQYETDLIFAGDIAPRAGHARIGGSIQQAFNTIDPAYIEIISRRFLHITSMLRAQGRITINCGGTHCSAGGASFTAAYVEGPNELTMCNVGTPGNRPISTFIHELAHAVLPQVGISNTVTHGQGVNDRAYRGDRAFRFLSPEETLDNADSYAVLAQLLHSGALTPLVSPPADTAPSCSQPDLALGAFARADQWHHFALHQLDLDVRLLNGAALNTLNQGNLQMLNRAFPSVTTTAELTTLRDHFQLLKRSGFDGSTWDMGCANAKDKNCGASVVAYSGGGKVETNSVTIGSLTSAHAVSLCPAWFNLPQNDQIRTIYAAFIIGRPSWMLSGMQLNNIYDFVDGASRMTDETIPAPTTTSPADHLRSNDQFHRNNPGSIP